MKDYYHYRIYMGDKGSFLVLSYCKDAVQEIRDWLDYQAIDYADVRLVEDPPRVAHYSNITRKNVDHYLSMGVK